MTAMYTVGLMVFVVLLAVFLIRLVHMTVDREFQNLARAVNDAEYRNDQLARVRSLLDPMLPLADDARPSPARPSGGIRLAAPILLFLGVALLWGGAFAKEDRNTWLWGGGVCCAVSGVVMLATLRRRKWERLARLLRFRADLLRLDGDRRASADDLRELVRVTPWDDAAWAELADDLSAQGDLAPALDAVRQASEIDPGYDEYRMQETSLSLRLNRLEEANNALLGWAAVDGVSADDPRLIIYQAALELARGKKDEAQKAIRRVFEMDNDLPLEIMDADQALDGVRELLPGDIPEAGDDGENGETGEGETEAER